MDISDAARIYPFSIGPSTVLGRTIAFKILFRKSAFHFRRELLRILSALLYRCRKFMRRYLSWLHFGNPRGVLAMVAMTAFVLKHFTNVKYKAELAYQRKFWKDMMKAALTYEEWAHGAKMLDKQTPKMKDSELYDEELVRNKLRELHHRRKNGSLRDIMFYMRADLFRNLGNMCNPELHKGRLQVPQLIEEYIHEVSTQLRMVCQSESQDLLLEEKLVFMHETRHAFGRTALLLSGGASLGVFHFGVVKTLVEQKLLPRIIAGTSAGSIVSAIVATRSCPELQTFFRDSCYSFEFFDQMGGIFTVVKRVMRQGALHDIRQLQMILRHFTGNLTFQEAYDMTGRVLGITVCSPRKHEPPRCLNYLTSPHVVIWSAVTASCAFPGLFEAQELMAKNRCGELVPYHPPFHLDPEEGVTITARRWRDGGLEMDLPMAQLKELFNVNHFIVSQTNPHASVILRFKEFVRAYGGTFAAKLAHIVEMEVKHRCNQMLQLGLPFQGVAKVVIQEWEGDITVVVPASPLQYMRLMQNPSHVDVQRAANQGRRCIWEKLSAIKANCGVELALDECVSVLNRIRRHKQSIKRAIAAAASHPTTLRFTPSARIPSWNCIARENSSSSLEEDPLPCNPSQNLPAEPSIESETSDLHSWTQSGGPLMRTTSADMFVHFIHSLSDDPSTSPDSSDPNNDSVCRRTMSNSSIVVAEGDLLQPERVHNGIVLNVVRRGDVGSVATNHGEFEERSDVEYLQLDYSQEEADDSAGSDCGDDSVPQVSGY